MRTYINFSAWAIDIFEEGHNLLGRFWPFVSVQAEVISRLKGTFPTPFLIPEHLKGCKVALFETRREARVNLPKIRETWEKAKVVKVDIKITY